MAAAERLEVSIGLDERSLRLLEFPAVQERLAGRCDTTMGREGAIALTPSTEPEQVRWRLLRTAEARALIASTSGVPLGGVRDLRPHLRRAAIGGVLGVEELGEVEQTLSSMRRSRALLEAGRERWPALWEEAQLLSDLQPLEDALRRAIGPEGLRDEASPELGRLRRERRQKEQGLRQRLEAMLRNPDVTRYLQDPIITVRSGRLCVPVLREHSARVPGVVHDASQTGQTLFVEPLFALELGNEAQALERRALQEEERILREFSGQVASHGLALEAGLTAAGALDLALALGRLADAMDAVEPEITPGRIRLRAARHPLLASPVPIDVELGPGRRLLVVTGPNTGGKTVSLKTVGLLQAMAQSGMQLPVALGSSVPVLSDVLCDIGDEQSIEQSLSTFSSHMTAIVDICARLGPDVLVLLDEIGAGTDPLEGAALAQAILEHLAGKGALGLVTTHYGELKAFAYATEDVENASMAFDPESLQPSYQLVQGAPGSSYAFVISARLGLPDDIVRRARGLLGEERMRLDDVLQRVDGLRHRLEARLKEADAAASAAEADRRRQAELRDAAEAERRAAHEEVRRRLEEDVAAARRSLRAARDELRSQRLQERRDEALQEARRLVGEVEERLARDDRPQEPPPGDAPDALRVGERVFVPQVGQEGVALTPPDDAGRLWVAVGSLRLQASLKDLRRIKGARREPESGGDWARLAQAKAVSVQSEVSLIGMRADEALSVLDRYLDDAQVAGLGTVRVIHGKGTGALRAAVHEFLQGDRRVKAHRLGAQGEGGIGATVVDLDV